MDKKALITLLGTILVMIAGYFVVTNVSYVPIQEFGGFPIPKAAEVIKEESIIEYYWSRASEEDGVPRSYQRELKKEGWEIKWRESSASMYRKDDIKVVLISSTNYLSISLTE
ncbi:hypothetical protein [Ornithinibacillus scapharcae]|uniref:hypothetical protein n=1 Tax=Ornithinibacillus scapharcae TaxID=1147159 RepID=UPI000225B599|nr:hypothetical protein [Ornithinibacillus scapharcae]